MKRNPQQSANEMAVEQNVRKVQGLTAAEIIKNYKNVRNCLPGMVAKLLTE